MTARARRPKPSVARAHAERVSAEPIPRVPEPWRPDPIRQPFEIKLPIAEITP
jgi:hypothetical protein